MKYSFKNIIAKNIRPFIIAEISANHGGNITKAKRMITAKKGRSSCCENSNL